MSVQPSFRPTLEALEARELPAGIQAYVTQGNLYVLGTNGNDFIQVTQTNQQLSVLGAKISVNGSSVNSINAASVGQVIVYGYNGDDFIDLTTVKNNANIYAGDGNDYVRCGTGNDTVNTGTGFDQVFRPFNPTTPIVNGATAADILQGQNPLCQTDASLADLAQQGYNIGNDIHYLGNSVYLVNLHGLPAQKVTFTGWTNNNDPVEPNSGEFWTVLMERARLQALGIDPTQQYSQTQWDALNVKTNGQLYSISSALYDFTGNPAFYTPSAYAGTPQGLQALLAQGNAVIAQSPSNGPYVNAAGIVGNHAYALTAVFSQNGVWTVRLYNPWGMNLVNGVATGDGFITLTWQQFTNSANFLGFFVAKL